MTMSYRHRHMLEASREAILRRQQISADKAQKNRHRTCGVVHMTRADAPAHSFRKPSFFAMSTIIRISPGGCCARCLSHCKGLGSNCVNSFNRRKNGGIVRCCCLPRVSSARMDS